MLVLGMHTDNHIDVTVPPSDKPTHIRMTLERPLNNARIGFIAPREVTIMRSDAHSKTAQEK